MSMAVTNPTTGVVEKTFEEDTAEMVGVKIALAQKAHEQLRQESYEQRAIWMRASADLMESDVATLAQMLVREMGKPIARQKLKFTSASRTCAFMQKRLPNSLLTSHWLTPAASTRALRMRCTSHWV